MPTYEYRCKACGHELEEFQSMTARPKRKCPECGKNQLERLIGTGAGVIFKGGGFYETDYRSESYKKAAKADSESSKGPKDAKDSKSSKSDSKPADKPKKSESSGKKTSTSSG